MDASAMECVPDKFSSKIPYLLNVTAWKRLGGKIEDQLEASPKLPLVLLPQRRAGSMGVGFNSSQLSGSTRGSMRVSPYFAPTF